MSVGKEPVIPAVVVETEVQFSLAELGRACGVEVTLIEALVSEGVLTPRGEDPAQWHFEGTVLPRARAATRLLVDLELGAPGTALVLELLDEIDALRARLRRLGG
jgi:chaperone modulatory protein CbpM